MNEEFETSEFKPGKIGGGQVHMVPTGHMKPTPKVTKIVHGNVDRLANPESTFKITSGLGTQVHNNGNELVLATTAMPLDVWQAGPEVPEPDQSAVLGRFDSPRVLSSSGGTTGSANEWHLWTTTDGDKTEGALGVTVDLYDRALTFDSTGTLVKIKKRDMSSVAAAVRQPFEVYLSGLMDGSSPKVFVAWGTVCETNPANNTAFPITNESLDKLWTLAPDEYIWLEAEFYESGSLITLKMKCGVPSANGWTNFPMSYASGSTVGGNFWRHPIAHYRAGRTSKSTVNTLAGNPYPDSGEEPEAHASYTIAQLTNTHLVALQVCEYADSVERRLIWKLTPGPGAVTGTGS